MAPRKHSYFSALPPHVALPLRWPPPPQAELARWVGPELVRAMLFEKLRDAQRADVEQLLADSPPGRPKPERMTRREAAKAAAAVAAAAPADGEHAGDPHASGAAAPGGAAAAEPEDEPMVRSCLVTCIRLKQGFSCLKAPHVCPTSRSLQLSLRGCFPPPCSPAAFGVVHPCPRAAAVASPSLPYISTTTCCLAG